MKKKIIPFLALAVIFCAAIFWLSAKDAKATCYGGSAGCSGNCVLGDCVKVPLSLPTSDECEDPLGYTGFTGNCGACWYLIPYGACGPGVATEACI